MSNLPLTENQFMQVFSALIVALHENNVLTLEQFTESFESTIARRKVDLGQTEEETAYALEFLKGLQRLKAVAPKP